MGLHKEIFPIRQLNLKGIASIAAESKDELRNFFAELAKDTGARRPEKLADQIQILLEGSIIVAQTGKVPDVIDMAKSMAKERIKWAIR